MSRAAIDSPQKAVEATCERMATAVTSPRPLMDSLGLILATDATTDRPSPPFDVSAMDGYAVASASIRPGRVRVAGEAMIGADPGRLDDAAAAIRVVTGAGIPRGADAVIRREDITESDGAFIDVPEATVAACRPGLAVRRAGENAPAGVALGLAGREIAAHVAASLASAGAATVRVHEPVRVGILATGDELVNHDATPGPWQIRDSNGPALLAMLSRRRWLAPSMPRRVHDDFGAATRAARELLETHDCLLLTGGVSMGHRDFVPDLVAALGASLVCHCLPQRPGKPLLLAEWRGKLIAGLPGNPQSVMVTSRRIVVPILSRVAGLASLAGEAHPMELEHSRERLALWWHRPVTITSPGRVRLVEGKGSGDVIAAGRSDGFVELEPERTVESPTHVPCYAWAW
jgi:molybdopterin molybdotransferase